METGTIVALLALLVALLGLILNSRKETRTDAAVTAQIQTKLDSLVTGVTDIRVELRSMRDSINNHTERLAKVEAIAEANSKRLDILENN